MSAFEVEAARQLVRGVSWDTWHGVTAVKHGDRPLRWRHHGLGMLQAELSESLRVHVWHPSLVSPGMVWPRCVHDHRFDIGSVVVVGAVRDVRPDCARSTTAASCTISTCPASRTHRATGRRRRSSRSCTRRSRIDSSHLPAARRRRAPSTWATSTSRERAATGPTRPRRATGSRAASSTRPRSTVSPSPSCTGATSTTGSLVCSARPTPTCPPCPARARRVRGAPRARRGRAARGRGRRRRDLPAGETRAAFDRTPPAGVGPRRGQQGQPLPRPGTRPTCSSTRKALGRKRPAVRRGA